MTIKEYNKKSRHPVLKKKIDSHQHAVKFPLTFRPCLRQKHMHYPGSGSQPFQLHHWIFNHCDGVHGRSYHLLQLEIKIIIGWHYTREQERFYCLDWFQFYHTLSLVEWHVHCLPASLHIGLLLTQTRNMLTQQILMGEL